MLLYVPMRVHCQNSPWHGRTYHPAEAGINELMSFVYGCTATQIRLNIEAFALDPHCGFLHEPGYGAGDLTYDLLEVVRTVFCDHIVLQAIRKNKVIRSFAAQHNVAQLPDNVRNPISKRLKKSMSITYSTQKISPGEQIKKLVEMIAFNLANGLPQFSKFLPER